MEKKFNDNVIMLKKSDFDDKLNLKKNGKVVVLYFANWCGHCNRLKPAYQQLADNASGFTVAAVDADDNDGLTEMILSMGEKNVPYLVQGYPTIVSYEDGKYYSTYGANNDKFRTFEDLMEYAKGIGSAPVTIK
jgi:thiol-disulfide isomerase/thioredoxin